ncbi:MAG: hypothetical protein LBS62_03330 [Clostridiales bacterium]|jgi:hypothetical protein|nr:hypothetical protein [Clostridiales bacterium]
MRPVRNFLRAALCAGLCLAAACAGADYNTRNQEEDNVMNENIQTSAPPTGLTCAFTVRGEGPTLGTWLWSAKDILTNTPSILEFLDKNNVSEVYIGYDRAVFNSKYRGFVKKAAALGIRSSIIGADARWVLPEGRKNYETFVVWYEKYQSECESEDEKFYGMHMDVEPYQLEEWGTGLQAVVDSYAAWVRAARADCDRLGALLELDIPIWFDKYTVTDGGLTLEEYCFTLADTVLLMDYRQTAAAMYASGERGLGLGQKYGKKVVLASETGDTTAEEPEITFYRLGKKKLYDEMTALRAMVDKNFPGGNIGYAIHWYNSWSALPEDGSK